MKKLLGLTVYSTMLMQLAACVGGNSSSTGTSINSNLMSGVAATGAPISNGTVQIKGRNGVIVQDLTGSDGSYSANIASLEEPYLIRVIAPSGEKYVSVASHSDLSQGKKINVTPLSHTIVANVFEQADADELFDNFETESSEFTELKLEDEKDKLVQKFVDAGLLGDGKIASANLDFLNGDLKAGTSLGLDGLLDVIDVNTGATAGVEIKLKGQSLPFITDKVANGEVDAHVLPVVGANLDSARAQLSVIDAIRRQMNALAAQYSSLSSCNGPAVDGAGVCGLDSMHALLEPYFHADFQEEGKGRSAAVWKWICEGSNEDAAVKSDCVGGEIKFKSVSLKDISLISLDESTHTALISLNMYEEGRLGKSEEMILKRDIADGKYKLVGNKKTFKYWIDTESVHSTEINKTSGSKVESYDVNLNFYYKDSGAHSFTGSESFTLTADSGHAIFPNGSSSMNLYLVQGPVYDKSSVCSSGLVFSTTSTPYKIYDQTSGTSSAATYAAACTNGDPCHCLNGSVEAQFDFESSRMVKLGLVEIIKMDKFEKINLAGTGVSDSFVIKKPMVINSINAGTFVPQFGMSSLAFCQNTDLEMPLNLSVATGALSDVSLFYGASSGSVWKNESAREDLWDLDLSHKVFAPTFSSLAPSDVLQYANLFLASRDEFDRRFVRRVNCSH